MSYLPAPYESAKQDDLPAAMGAGLTVTVAGITCWMLGQWSFRHIAGLIDTGRAGSPLPAAELIPAAGWAAAVLLMVLGGLLLVFRRGRGALIFGALVSIATTAVARYTFGWGTPASPVPQWALYWGGAAVLVLAALPATGRWVAKTGVAAPAFPTTAVYRPR